MNFYRINRGLNKRLHNYFFYLSRRAQYRDKIRKVNKELKCKPLTKLQKNEAKNYYASFGFNNINTDWHKYFTHVRGEFHKEYMPEDLFYNVIIPHLNMVSMHTALTDKNLLTKLFNGVKQPETIVKNINGIFYSEKDNAILRINNVVEKCSTYSKLIIKPSLDSGGGKNIIVFNVKGNMTDYKDMAIEKLIKMYGNDFIIQNYLIQHEQMSMLNPSSVNTIRSTTLLIDGKVEFLRNFIRIGGKHSMVDNVGQGGIWCIINSDGTLSKNIYDKIGNFVVDTDIITLLNDFRIPNYNKIINDITYLHRQIPQFRLVSWDIALDNVGDTVLIEINVFGQGIDGQYAYGPLFGKYTDRLLSACKLNRFSDQVFR